MNASLLDPKSPIDLSPSALRKIVLEMAYYGKTVHIACAFSLIEMVSVLYRKHVRFNLKDPRAADRDYVVLSKGHGVMALYAAFHQLGWLERSAVEKYFSDGSLLHGLSECHVPGLEVTSGSLGHGLPIATGMALGLKRTAKAEGAEAKKVFCIVGDGEMNEGSMWEAILFAAHHRLDNLKVLVDANGFQAMGKIEDVLGMEPFVDKFKAFGWDAVECDGHSVDALDRELSRPLSKTSEPGGKPRAIIARTVKGKGVSFMEGDNRWHYTRLDDEMFRAAVAEVEGKGAARA